jgi:hypothetical protein
MRKISEKSSETIAILAVFCDMILNQKMSFEELSGTVKFRVNSSTAAYTSARKIAERDHKIYIEAIPKFGFFRGNAEAMADSLDPMASRMKRIAKKSISRADLAIEHNLPDEKYNRVAERRSRASIIYSTSNAPMPKSNRKRRETDLPIAEPVSRFDAIKKSSLK